jgi:hypothetical protein
MRQSSRRSSIAQVPFFAVKLSMPVRPAILVGLMFLSTVTGPRSVASAVHASNDAGIWRPISGTGGPAARSGPAAVWTGSEMLLWGGRADGRDLGDGAAYAPATDTWRPLSQSGAPGARSGHSAIWTGHEMVVWGGTGPRGDLADGARYDPDTDTWRPISVTDAPSPRAGHLSVWTGDHMLVWGGANEHSGSFQNGAAYDPITDTWTPLPETDAASWIGSAVWTGSEMIVLGAGLGAAYDPVEESWRSLPIEDGPSPRLQSATVWTGADVLVWGGIDCCGLAEPPALDNGARYNAAEDAWTSLASDGRPSSRAGHSGVWTGDEMLIWGGAEYGRVASNTGARYIPSSDSWTSLPTAGAPSARAFHIAVWTGSEMLVWGGTGPTGLLGDGGRFTPSLQNTAGR